MDFHKISYGNLIKIRETDNVHEALHGLKVERRLIENKKVALNKSSFLSFLSPLEAYVA